MNKYLGFKLVYLVFYALSYLARPSESVRIISNQHGVLQQLDQDVTQIILNKDVQISTSDDHIKLTGKIDRVLLTSSTGSILMSNFSSLSLILFGSNQSNQPNGTNSTDADDRPDEPGTPTEVRHDDLLLANSTRFKNWVNSTNLFHGRIVTLFNITNYNAVLNGSIPVLQEEEFRFEQKRTIQVIDWEEDERFVKIKQIRHYSYASPRDLEQTITTINYPLVVSTTCQVAWFEFYDVLISFYQFRFPIDFV